MAADSGDFDHAGEEVRGGQPGEGLVSAIPDGFGVSRCPGIGGDVAPGSFKVSRLEQASRMRDLFAKNLPRGYVSRVAINNPNCGRRQGCVRRRKNRGRHAKRKITVHGVRLSQLGASGNVFSHRLMLIRSADHGFLARGNRMEAPSGWGGLTSGTRKKIGCCTPFFKWF